MERLLLRSTTLILLVSVIILQNGCTGQPDSATHQINPQAHSSAVPIPKSQEEKPKASPTTEAPPSPPSPSTYPPNGPRVQSTNDNRQPISQNVQVKGIYVSAWSTVGSKFDKLVKLVDDTDLNAMVIDVKNDSGQVTHPSKVPLVNEIGANSNIIIKDMKAKLLYLKEKNIYSIARIVVFKDPYLSKKKPDYAMKRKSGGVWKDNKGIAWVDPYIEDVWNYNIEIAKEAASLGFDEIQFDYVRFPDNGRKVDKEVTFSNNRGWSKPEVIEGFLKRAKEQIKGTPISADVFGLTTSSDNDMGIGQEWNRISKYVNTISPMLYPSHYSSGVYGVKHPDLQPYAIIHKAIGDAILKNNILQKQGIQAAGIRPWFQDFTATWVKPHQTYDANDVREQVKAAKEYQVEQFILWNSTSTYTYR
ncbi:putative glycoside hydrolase [Paenibacillus hexagrammi]|uniref:Glycoside hydrolase n=1 Tax=Paenibacillus hexagrammi TaxID=2908839 RepID=A0ABY3SIG7_9BACL|nr:putative glycoside hydrolase [Paenibacillus sp. YPD9-1]UJF33305.1 putative glycoside hydrolase [Paenibacillus sp. YPD9-1]